MLFRHLNPPGTGYYAQCEQWLQASANQGSAKGMSFLAQFYYADGVAIAGGINPGINNAPIPPALQAQAERRFVLARQWFERSAAKGDGYAMGNLAIMLDSGVGGPRDAARAARLRAQVAGHSDADFASRATKDPGNLAMTAAWQSGHYADALQNAQALAAKGDTNAEALLGKAYYEGVGVARNYATALTWLNRAVAKNNADAMFILGLMYEHGRGVPQDIPRSLQLFDRAAMLGQRYAQMEAKGMRLQGESNRIAALIHANSTTEDIACETAGGISTPGACIRGGQNIDPWNPNK
jgi:TPR repeat protein